MLKILRYALEWHTKVNQGKVRLRLENGREDTIPVESPEQMAAYAAILSQAPVFFNGNIISTHWEPVVDESDYAA